MTSYAAERRLRLRHVYARSVDVAVLTTDANARRRVRFVWLLLFANVLSFGDGATLIPIPGSIARPLLQAALLAALVLALTVNPRALVLPSVYLLALTLLAGSALAMGLQNEFYLGSTYRALRLATFVVTLWLLTPWWSAPGRPLLRFHLQALGAVLASVAVGAIVAPGKAFSFEGRLSGAVWPIPATQVAHYAAVALGVGVLLWLSGRPTTKAGVLAVLGGAAVLVLTHTRTALMAMLAGILVGGVSLFLGRARVRKAFVTSAVVATLGATAYAPVVGEWLRRGQDTTAVSNLTGRTEVWNALLAAPRTGFHQVFGYGLSNKSFNGLPIDSSWLSTYQDQGFLGLTFVVLVLLALTVGALSRPRSAERALVLFLVTYSIVASITETGLGDASPYLLDLTVAASLLVPSRRPLA